MISVQQRQFILRELAAIAGKYNFSSRHGWRSSIKCYTWYKTKRGRRAGDWHILLVMADKARDLGCDVVFSRPLRYFKLGIERKIPIACPERLATAITIYLPD